MDVQAARGYRKFGQLPMDVHRTEDFAVEVKQSLVPLFLEARRNGSWREMGKVVAKIHGTKSAAPK